MKKVLYLVIFFAVNFSFAQDYTGVIQSYLTNNRSQLGLEASDISDIKVERQSHSNSMQLDNVYVIQQYQGIEVFNSVTAFAVKNGTVHLSKHSFIQNLATKVNATSPAITANTAINKAALALNIGTPSGVILLETLSANSFVFSNGNISYENIPVKLVFQPMENNTLKLAWDLSISLLNGQNYYSVRIDALTGDVLSTHDWVAHCVFEKEPHLGNHVFKKGEKSILFPQNDIETTKNNMGSVQYNVFGLPLESPSHGANTLIVNPADSNASPFGWHDTNGVNGAEFTITRGNNVHAQEDRNDNNGIGASPDGGPGLNFDFPYNFNTSPVNMLDAVTVNLFYWNNIMHDVWYQYGFDEASGNFQENNYGNGGAGSDSVNADAQDGGGLNNANFGTPPDGGNPRMQMYLWSAAGPAGEPLTINNGPLAGNYQGLVAGFGAPLPSSPLTADLVLVLDNNSGTSTDANDACDPITNGSALIGKIAVIRRGGCEFGFKVLAAETQGAVAVIIVNNVNTAIITMGAGAVGASVTIPSIMVSQADGEAIITELGTNTINGSLVEAGPFQLDGDVDNGIIAHEYGHGISNRLTGGPAQAGCLQNDEQMGEGWSDWFGLMLTMRAGDQGADGRGIGTYATGQPITGGGIRPRRYSTDFSINELTYADTNNAGFSQPHGIGSIWATMIWDLNWALIDQYGFDDDFYTGTGGNNLAMQLVMDGLKLQNCSPGFVDGRNAILMADELANGGANRCLIWNAFARRGLGLNANQGSSNNRFDQVENFDVPAECELGLDDQGFLDKNFTIYPNPSNGNINVKTLIPVGDVAISIFDMNGRKVFAQDVTLNNTIALKAEGLTPGVYVMHIDGGNYSHTARILIK